MGCVRTCLAVGLALFLGATANAQFRDATAKMRGDFGVVDSSARGGYRDYSNEGAPAAPEQSAPATAAAPRQERSYSVEPQPQAARPAVPRAEAARPRTTRSYSYEPSAPSYSYPSRGRQTPPYLMLKTNPRKF